MFLLERRTSLLRIWEPTYHLTLKLKTCRQSKQTVTNTFSRVINGLVMAMMEVNNLISGEFIPMSWLHISDNTTQNSLARCVMSIMWSINTPVSTKRRRTWLHWSQWQHLTFPLVHLSCVMPSIISIPPCRLSLHLHDRHPSQFEVQMVSITITISGQWSHFLLFVVRNSILHY